MPKRLHGYNPDGEWDTVIGRNLPLGWTKTDPKAEPDVDAAEPDVEATEPEEPPKRRGRPPKVA